MSKKYQESKSRDQRVFAMQNQAQNIVQNDSSSDNPKKVFRFPFINQFKSHFISISINKKNRKFRDYY